MSLSKLFHPSYPCRSASRYLGVEVMRSVIRLALIEMRLFPLCLFCSICTRQAAGSNQIRINNLDMNSE